MSAVLATPWTRGSLRTPRFSPDPEARGNSALSGYRRIRRYFEPSEVHLRAKEEELRIAEDAEAKTEKRLEELEVVWKRRRADVVQEIKECQLQRHAVNRLIVEVKHLRQPGGEAPGPAWLRFVDGNWFLAMSACVVASNMVAMGVELGSPNSDFWVLDQCFLVWYIMELCLTIWYHGLRILRGLSTMCLMTWLDLVLVTLGVTDQWALPALSAVGAAPGQQGTAHAGNYLQLLRFLRLARLTRVLKLVHVLRTADLSWTERPWFQSLIMGTIVLNSATLGLETDVAWPGWFYIDQVFLLIFAFELMVRLRNDGLGFFCATDDWGWNNLDLVIVLGGIFDQWAIPLMSFIATIVLGQQAHNESNFGRMIQLLRLMRLVRILRLVRLVKGVRPLYNLMGGIVEAMQGMQWVVVLTTLILYGFALLATRLIGHGLVFGDQEPQDVAAIFPSVPEAMFVLFQVMNGKQQELEPLFKDLPFTKLVFVGFMVVSNWAILAILTAVVSENMLRATEASEDMERTAELSSSMERQCERLSQIFYDIDLDGSKYITKSAFQDLLDDDNLRAELCEVSALQRRDLEDLFTVLAEEDDSGQKVNYDHFISKLIMEDKPVREISVFNLEKQVRHLEKRIRADLQEVLHEIDVTMRRPKTVSRRFAQTHLNQDAEDAGVPNLRSQRSSGSLGSRSHCSVSSDMSSFPTGDTATTSNEGAPQLAVGDSAAVGS